VILSSRPTEKPITASAINVTAIIANEAQLSAIAEAPTLHFKLAWLIVDMVEAVEAAATCCHRED
jgi:hypothetical protein